MPERARGRLPFLLSALRAAALLAVGACGARSPLAPGDLAGPADAHGGAAGSGAAGDGAGGAGGSVVEPTCRVDDLSTWSVERYRDDGDYERAAVAVGGAPWVALKVRDGNIVLARLGLASDGVTLVEQVEIPGAPVYPVAFDVDDRRFVVLTTTGINWNGDVELWRVDRVDGSVQSVPIGNPPEDPAYTIYSAIGLAGDEIAVAYARAIEGQGTIELRDDQLALVGTLPIAEISFTAVRTSDSAVDVYAGAATRVHVEGGGFDVQSVDPAWQVFGGLGSYLVEIGPQIRLRQGDATWAADWPHTQISPPAVVRTDGGRAAFSLETELTAVVGHTTSGALEWLAIEPTLDAPGLGVGLMPVVEPGRLGLFYLGLEIPSPEQPLRYFGLSCGAGR